MASKRGILKALGIFLLGFLAGGIILGGLIGWGYSKFFRDMYYLKISEATNTVFMIRAGQQEELVKMLEIGIPELVTAADSMRGDNKLRLSALWYVQRYYQTFDINVPADIKPILDSLPPRPATSCEIKKVQEAEPNKNDSGLMRLNFTDNEAGVVATEAE